MPENNPATLDDYFRGFPPRERAEELVRVAEAIGLRATSITALNMWRRGERQVPAERVIALEAATGVSRHVLRPDLYPAESAA